MNCLCCGKPLNEASLSEQKSGWHNKCVKAFFGTKELPEIDITDASLQKIVTQNTGKGFTVPGVQKKLSLYLNRGSSSEKPRLTLVNFPKSGYILKPQTEEYRALPEAEFAVMQMARLTGIKTVPFALLGNADEGYAYITKRIDRRFDNAGNVAERLAMEDFCQLAERLTADKYKGSYERCAKIISDFSSRPGLDLSELYLRLVFCFAVGNSDMHLKNFSLVETSQGNGNYELSSAYDLLPVNIILTGDTEQFALTMNGKKSRLKSRDFEEFANACGILPKAARKLTNEVVQKREEYIAICRASLMPERRKADFEKLLEERIKILCGEE